MDFEGIPSNFTLDAHCANIYAPFLNLIKRSVLVSDMDMGLDFGLFTISISTGG